MKWVRYVVLLAAPLFVFACRSVLGISSDDGAPSDGGVQDASNDAYTAQGDTGAGSQDAGDAGDTGAGEIDAGDSGAPEGPTTPPQIWGPDALQLWFTDQGLMSGFEVFVWNDSSGHGRGATPIGTGTLDHLVKDVNGHDAVGFDGQTGAQLLAQDPLVGRTQDFYLAVVARYSAPAAGFSFLTSRFDGSLHGYGLFGTSPGSSRAGATLDEEDGGALVSALGATADDMYRIYSVRRTMSGTSNALLEVRVEGSSTAVLVSNPPVGDESSRTIILGGALDTAGNGMAYLNGAIAEMVLVVGAVSDADIMRAEAGWKQKYALP